MQNLFGAFKKTFTSVFYNDAAQSQIEREKKWLIREEGTSCVRDDVEFWVVRWNASRLKPDEKIEKSSEKEVTSERFRNARGAGNCRQILVLPYVVDRTWMARRAKYIDKWQVDLSIMG